jgi:hypothetical protein
MPPDVRHDYEFIKQEFLFGYPEIPVRTQFNWWYPAFFHRDNWRNGGPSLLLVGGAFTGGQLYFAGRQYPVDRPLWFDGRCWHRVCDFVGPRVSVVFYYDTTTIPVQYLIGRDALDPPRLVRRAGAVLSFVSTPTPALHLIRRAWDALSLAEGDGQIASILQRFKKSYRDLQIDLQHYPVKPSLPRLSTKRLSITSSGRVTLN